MRNAHQQTLAFQAVNRLAQRPATDAIGTRQFRLGDLAARGDLAFDDGGLDATKNMLGQGFRVILNDTGQLNGSGHIVDTSCVICLKITR
ncbi:hypothetical protein D3C85_702810 [compost metagenome]